jgi:1-deoxy-D-xylulose-5-phosphate reductoisomerase
MEVVGIAAGSNVELLARQIQETGVKHAAIFDPTKRDALAQLVSSDVHIYTGKEGLCELAQLEEADMVLISIIGTEGLQPALKAIEAHKDLAIASKEILVMAGEIVMTAAEKAGISVLPVDSEHNAIYQCLQVDHKGPEQVSRLILTASGGPFRKASPEDLVNVTVEQALKHPTWSMGKKITIDSATMFNKGLEMIEARWLFGLPMDKVDVIIHPQSIIHSMVEYIDGSVIAQLSQSDMCFPIQYAVTWPDRVPNSLHALNFSQLAHLDFEAPRPDVFPALRLARWAGEESGTLPAVLNAANEIAVAAFMRREIGFTDIWKIVEKVMTAHQVVKHAGDLTPILEADAWARLQASQACQALH